MGKIVLKKTGEKHFRKQIGEDGSFSDRIILPGKDNCRVKVTLFQPVAGEGLNGEEIKYGADETFYILDGTVEICFDNDFRELHSGALVHVPAGESYRIRALSKAKILCFFSAVASTLPDDD